MTNPELNPNSVQTAQEIQEQLEYEKWCLGKALDDRDHALANNQREVAEYCNLDIENARVRIGLLKARL